MRLLVAAGAIALALVAASADAASWTPVASSPDQAQFDLDTSSVQTSGGYVTDWVRETMPKLMWDAQARAWYRVVLMQRAERCRDRTTAITAALLVDDKGRTTSNRTTPPDRWQFMAQAPGTVSQVIQSQACALAASRAALKPALSVGPATEADWRIVAADATSNYSVDDKNVKLLEEGKLAVVERQVGSSLLKRADGLEYASAYTLMMFDCHAGSFGIAVSDQYDSNGVLVGSYTTSKEQFRLDAVRPGSVAEAVEHAACAVAPAAADASGQTPAGPQTGSGTAWLGPKGYLVTAAHVVKGATAITLAQDGAMVGSAEVVAADPANDVAILKPKFAGGSYLALQLSETPARLGEKVFTLGYPAPDELGLALKMTSGDISALAGSDGASARLDDVRLIQISIPVQPGNSGGPVMDSAGRTLGIVVSGLPMISTDQPAQNVNYALKIGYVRSLLADLPAIGAYRPVRPATSIVGEVAAAKSAVFLVLVETDGAGE
jgi:S1-C subfamily serine protease